MNRHYSFRTWQPSFRVPLKKPFMIMVRSVRTCVVSGSILTWGLLSPHANQTKQRFNSPGSMGSPCLFFSHKLSLSRSLSHTKLVPDHSWCHNFFSLRRPTACVLFTPSLSHGPHPSCGYSRISIHAFAVLCCPTCKILHPTNNNNNNDDDDDNQKRTLWIMDS